MSMNVSFFLFPRLCLKAGAKVTILFDWASFLKIIFEIYFFQLFNPNNARNVSLSAGAKVTLKSSFPNLF